MESAKNVLAVGLFISCLGCGGNDDAVISTRNATDMQCSDGGTVLLLDEEIVSVVCNGSPGDDGERGERGERGTEGVRGAEGGTGPSGPAGPAGENGTAGEVGATGISVPSDEFGFAGQLVQDTGECFALSSEAPFMAVTLQYAEFADFSLFASIRCTTGAAQDSTSRLFSSTDTLANVSISCSLVEPGLDGEDSAFVAANIELDMFARIAIVTIGSLSEEQDVIVLALNAISCPISS